MLTAFFTVEPDFLTLEVETATQHLKLEGKALSTLTNSGSTKKEMVRILIGSDLLCRSEYALQFNFKHYIIINTLI